MRTVVAKVIDSSVDDLTARFGELIQSLMVLAGSPSFGVRELERRLGEQMMTLSH